MLTKNLVMEKVFLKKKSLNTGIKNIRICIVRRKKVRSVGRRKGARGRKRKGKKSEKRIFFSFTGKKKSREKIVINLNLTLL